LTLFTSGHEARLSSAKMLLPFLTNRMPIGPDHVSRHVTNAIAVRHDLIRPVVAGRCRRRVVDTLMNAGLLEGLVVATVIGLHDEACHTT
jgi:hypothetical protein